MLFILNLSLNDLTFIHVSVIIDDKYAIFFIVDTGNTLFSDTTFSDSPRRHQSSYNKCFFVKSYRPIYQICWEHFLHIYLLNIAGLWA